MAQQAASSIAYATALFGTVLGAGAIAHASVTATSMTYPALPISSAVPDAREIFGDREPPTAIVPDSKRRVLVRQVLLFYRGNMDEHAFPRIYADKMEYTDAAVSTSDKSILARGGRVIKWLKPTEVSHTAKHFEDCIILRRTNQYSFPFMEVVLPSTVVLDLDKEGRVVRQRDFWFRKSQLTFAGIDVTKPSRMLNAHILAFLGGD